MFNDKNVKEKEEMTTIAGDFATLIASAINPWEMPDLGSSPGGVVSS